MKLVIVRNDTDFDFQIPYGELAGLGSRPGSLDIPRGISFQRAATWNETLPDKATTGSGGGFTGSRPPTLREALDNGDVSVEERDVDHDEATEEDPADIATKLCEVYQSHTKRIHTAMSSTWSGAARRFGVSIGASLNEISRRQAPLDDEQVELLKAVSVLVDELFQHEVSPAV